MISAKVLRTFRGASTCPIASLGSEMRTARAKLNREIVYRIAYPEVCP